ncbi:MAG TPA: hypothetical protein VFA33_09415 [Bryobacteraceae bacterium]|nr:hypothetical protein [Bryobacteraceae bacterium]
MKDYVYSYDPEGPYADHELTDFERQMIKDFLGGLFSDTAFSDLLQKAAASMKAGGMDPEDPDQ